MKRLAILLITVLTFASCGDEVEFNSPSIQGTKDYVLWRAEYFNADIDSNGYLTITGGNNIETLELRIPSVAIGLYNLGDVESMEARFTAADGTVYSTNYPEDESNQPVYTEYGFIKLDEIINNTFTGRFEFNAYNIDGTDVINFGGVTEQNGGSNDTGEDPIGGGIFYRVPLTSGSFPTTIITCDDAQEQTELLEAAFVATTAPELTYVSSADYVMACEAFAAALETQRIYCGDIGGALQNQIDDLNACVFPCGIALDNRNTAETAFNNATIGNYVAACLDYQFYLQEQINFCGDPDGSIQLELDGLNCADSDGDGIPDIFEDFNGDEDLDNDDSDSDGTPNYLDDDDDGDGILTINEAKDIDGNPIDTDGDNDVDYLDTDDDGDGVLTQNESGDTDGDGIPNYIDADDDGDSVLTVFEDINNDGNPVNDDTDADGTPNYLDDDDDGDGLLTINENPDPNMDGDPADADDTDMDGVPDYLDNV
ncbi:DUF6252 family protein [Psychroserpens mesophilus]|uniref:DUF6252 family protein n=1 Tax=Psychroserpens mesophilus TaxID=325473 RepID=UPI003D653341